MKKRKRIGLAIINPETTYQSRVLEGIITQCERYDYDLISFTPLTDIWFQDREYLGAEMNIFELINFDLIDGLIVIAISMTRNQDYSEVERFERFLKVCATKPVVSIDLDVKGAETVCTNDLPAFMRITEHILNVHKVPPEDVYVLTGRENLEISQMRVDGVRRVMKQHGYELDQSQIFYGDFWFSSGTNLAEKIISGQVKMPRAVICGNDHMAIGLTNRLIKEGIKVPEQVIVTGYDATSDAVTNEVPITSFEPNVANAAEEAVNSLRRKIDPELPVIPADEPDERNMCIGASCGCQTNINYLRNNFRTALYRTSHDYTQGFFNDTSDMFTVIESYMLEKLTAARNPNDCLKLIFMFTYLIRPFRNFYLCLRPDWLNTNHTLRHGYPDIMRTVIHTVPEGEMSRDDPHVFCSENECEEFETDSLLPVMDTPRDKPGVFYFAPVHFQEDTLGFCVLHCDLSDHVKPTAVFRNWLRNVNNALEMMRVQNKLIGYSLYDSMTGLYNRRGMDRAFKQLCQGASEGDSCFVCVIDMNWLKKINDNYGHAAGDQAILQLAECTSRLASDEHFAAVRAGGDEFFVIGIGRFGDELREQKRERLNKLIERINAAGENPYRLSASFGCCLRTYSPDIKLEELIHEADAEMYENKKQIKSTMSF